jgi:hypothetical protein
LYVPIGFSWDFCLFLYPTDALLLRWINESWPTRIRVSLPWISKLKGCPLDRWSLYYMFRVHWVDYCPLIFSRRNKVGILYFIEKNNLIYLILSSYMKSWTGKNDLKTHCIGT